MRWWGWGEDGAGPTLPAAADGLLGAQLGVEPGAGGPPVALEEVRLPDPSLSAAVREQLTSIVAAEHVLDDRLSRVSRAAGRSYPDLIRLRSGDGSGAPDVVVRPGTADQVAAVLQACSDAQVAVVPFGGGTSVVGGVEAGAGSISLDLGRMDRLLRVDPVSLTATIEAGMLGPAAEAALAEHGVTLGHFPQSFEHSTVGGWVATRSAGQASTGYGRIDELVEGLRLVTPVGELSLPALPASAAGPSLQELVVGSEGTLGVICEATLRVQRAPTTRRYEGWSFRSFDEGAEAFRVMEQAGESPDVARLSDELETRVGMAAAAGDTTKERLARAYLRARGHEGGCLAIVGFEGDGENVEARRLRTGAMLRAGGGLALGRGAGDAWHRSRFAAPYLRDDLLDRGVMVETLETATTWTNLGSLYASVAATLRETLAARGTPPIVMCHVSHLYRSGASLYFTFMARQEAGDPLGQWRAAKTAASDAIVAGGGTITHHHAVGKDHAPWLRAEIGELGVEVLQAIKERLDPAGIMNPGKLLPTEPAPATSAGAAQPAQGSPASPA